MTRPRMPKLGFRARLTLNIAVVFIAAGGALLAAQFLVVQQLFDSALQMTIIACNPATPPPAPTGADEQVPWCPSQGIEPTEGGPGSIEGDEPVPLEGEETIAGRAAIVQTAYLSGRIVGGLLVWSIGLLLGFAVIAALMSARLARRPLERIGEVTAAAQAMSERDLDRRLRLPGPDDEFKELGDTFDGMLDRLQTAFTAQDRFVANASHELRTPLTTARTALEVPLEHGEIPEHLEPAIRRALRATEHSERLIEALLALARGSVVHDLAPVELGPLIEEARATFADAAAERNVSIALDLAPASALADAVLLDRAVRNLIDNAVRHNMTGGAVEVRVTRIDDEVVISIVNTGPELDEATIALLTEPFYRGERSRLADPTGGVGLGLAIVRSIATNHDGRLDLAPRPGGGLIARLTLPAAPATP